jgi:hypothetical protein
LPHNLRIFEDNVPSDEENLPDPNEHVDTPVAALPAPTPIIPLIPDPPRRSNRVLKPTRAILEMELFHRAEEQARLAGEEWAHDCARPMANTVDVDWLSFDDTLLVSPWAFTSAVKGMVPRSYREVMREPEKWGPAMQAEFDQLVQCGVWKLVDLPEGQYVIDGMWVFDLKVDGEGKTVKHKGRYVMRGDEMVEGRDFGTKWAMVARMESVRMVFAVVAVKRLVVRQMGLLRGISE